VVQEKKITSPREREERRPGETEKKKIINLKERGRAETLVVQEKKKYQSCILRSLLRRSAMNLK